MQGSAFLHGSLVQKGLPVGTEQHPTSRSYQSASRAYVQVLQNFQNKQKPQAAASWILPCNVVWLVKKCMVPYG